MVMDYSFKYKPKHIKRTFAERKNHFLSEILYALYRTKLYKLLGLDSDRSVKQCCNYHSINCKVKNNLEFPGIKVNNVLFSDIIKIEETKIYEKQIIKAASKLKPVVLQDNAKKVFKNSFNKIDSNYSTVSIDTPFRGRVSGNSKTDLIDYVSIGYVKGKESCLIIKYRVFPSEKFNKLLRECLEQDTTTAYEVIDVSLKDFFRTKDGHYGGVKHSTRNAKYWTKRLFQELNFQLKFQVLKNVKTGTFIRQKDRLFPSIVSFEYNKNAMSGYEDRLHRIIHEGFRRAYKFDDLQITYDYCDLDREPNHSLNILLSTRKKEELEHGLNSIDYVSQRYSDEILPKFMLINLANLRHQLVVELRKKIFKHIKKNKVSLFLTKTIKLKNSLTLSILNFDRISKDILEDDRMYKNNFDDKVIPHAIRECRNEKCTKEHSFKSEFNDDCEHTVKDLKKSFTDLSNLFQSVSDDNQSRANMRLQRLLFWLAVLGILLTLYGTNTEWINSWIEYFLSKIGWGIPRV